ncbi:MAG: hypothetical protein IT289_04010, partial [Oligoflexia bacterium]|nr:hypothetical protein [Oligoflexia bacterium]
MNPNGTLGLVISLVCFGLTLTFWPKHQPERQPQSDFLGSLSDAVIYENTKVIKKGAKIALRLAVPIISKLKIESYLKELPLDDEVRRRVLSRINSGEFIDAVVPFLWSLKTQYASPVDSIPTFEQYIKAQFKNPITPGMTHSLFSWAPPTEKSKTESFKLDPGIAASLVRFYDKIFLQTGKSPLFEERPVGEAEVKELKPIVKDLLSKLGQAMKDNSDVQEGLNTILNNDEKLEILTHTLLQAVSQEAFKAYQMFAQKVLRADALKQALLSSLEKKGTSPLWSYLENANRSRRYVIQFTVDGLQGELVRALASGQPQHPFVAEIKKTLTPPSRPKGRKIFESPKTSQRFFEHFAQNGYQHPAYLPFFKWLSQSRQRGFVSRGVSTTPTISVRNLPLIKTGAPVAGSHS